MFVSLGGFSFIVIGESISGSAEYVHVYLQALFFSFNLFFGSYVTLDSQSDWIYGFKHFDEYFRPWKGRID